MEIGEQRKLKAAIQARQEIAEVIAMLDRHDPDIELDGGYPINHAMNYNRNEIVRYLVERGADVNAKQDGHYTPLMSAAEGGNADMVALLLQHGADINATDKHGNTAFWKAVHGTHLEVVKLLVEAGADPFVLYRDVETMYDAAKGMGLDDIAAYFDTLRE